MKSKITKIQILKKGILLILMLAILLPSSIYAVEGLTLQESTALEKLMYGEIGSVVKKIEEHFKSNTTLYIVNETQLRALAEYVNSGNSCYGKEIKLLNDIILNGNIDWTPIGNSNSEFSGAFYGNGYTISNLTYMNRENYVTEGGYSNVGLFGVISKNGKVEKVNVNDSNIKFNNELDKNKISNVGNIAGTSYGKIKDCSANIMPLGVPQVNEDRSGNEGNNYIGLLVGEKKDGATITTTDTKQPEVNITVNSDTIKGDFKLYQKQGDDFVETTDFVNTTYLKVNDTIRFEFTLDKYLYTGLENGRTIKLANTVDDEGNVTEEIAKENYPMVSFAGVKATPIEVIQEEITLEDDTKKPQTKLVYEYTATGEEEKESSSSSIIVDFTKNKDNENLYVYYSDDKVNFYTRDQIEQSVSISGVSIKLDSNVPSINTEAYVEEALANNRYAEGKEIIIKVTSSEQIQATIAPELKVSFSESGLGKYNYQTDSSKGNAVHVDAILDGEGKTVWTYSYIIQPGDEGKLNVEYISGKIKDLCENETNLATLETYTSVIYADTTAPTVKIKSIKALKETTYDFNGDGYTDEEDIICLGLFVNNDIELDDEIRNNISNNNKGDINNDGKINVKDRTALEKKLIEEYNLIIYTFKWSEPVTGFTEDDIEVTNGLKGTFKATDEDENGYATEYSLEIETTVKEGNVGDIQVIIEQNVCQDKVGQGNVRAESTITVDKKAPILLGLEAYAESDIALNKDIDVVKENYKIGENITIVATFDESIVSVEEDIIGLPLPILALQFSESGNAKGTVSPGTKSGNKITYTYTIANRDEGTLSVKGFTGTVVDAAGNETIVTKKALDGNTIIADTKAPKLNELNVVSSTGTYTNIGGTPIKIEAIYDEEVYALNDNEIINISQTSAPILKIKFGEDGIVKSVDPSQSRADKTKLIYNYHIEDGDNGDLIIDSYENKENVKVCDIAGNEAELNKNQTGNKITADTMRPKVDSITAIVEDSIINGTEIYYKEGNTVKIALTFSENVNAVNNMPKILIGFSENAEVEPEVYNDYAYESDWNVNSTTIEYSYTIKNGDNGYLWVKVPEGQFKDTARNTNIEKEATQVSTIYADTVRPFYGDQPGIEYVDNEYKVTFNENLYYLSADNVVTSFGDINQAPLLKFEGKETEYIPSISNNVITYAGNYINAKPYLGASRLCDKAGNLYSYYDQEAPKLLKIEVTSPETGTYKAGQETTIVAEFNEKVIGTAPTLMIVFGDGETREIDAGNIKDNTIEYKYIIQNGDNGSLAIIDYNGTGLTDLDNNKWVKPESLPTLTGKIITADTKAPTLTITSDVERTNKEVVTYTFTWSEIVKGFTAEDIEVTNGSKGAFKATDEDENGYATKYTLEVDTTNEGRQIVKVNSGVCEDIAGNENLERVTYNKVVIDYTKPVIRAKVNGGNYVLDNTDPENKKSTLKETIVIDEELSSMQYVWSSSETIPEAGWISEDVSTILVNSDFNLTKEVKETGTYYLYIKATDIAGNILSTRTKAFVVKTSQIKLIPDKTDITNQDVTVTVVYEEGLTENRKAGVSGLTQSADASKVIITENGTVYAEATDKAGNKVCKVLEIENIDKVAPEGTITYVTNEDKSVTATISFNEENVTITNNNGESTYVFEENGEFTYEFRDAAGNTNTAKAVVESIKELDKIAPTITFSYTTTIATVGTPIGATITTDEDAIISYSWDNKTWNSSEDYVRSQKVVKTPTTAGSYTLYAKAIDKSSNASTVQSLQFTVVRSEEEIKTPEIIFEDLPIIQVNGVKYVKIFEGMTTENLASKMNKQALLGKTPEYIKLTEDNKLRTGSEITINGETKYIVVVKGDINCDGKAGDFIEDIMALNRYRIKGTGLSTEQVLAGDINNDRIIDFIDDIMQINRYRIGIISIL